MSLLLSSPLPDLLALLRTIFHTRVTVSSSQPLCLISKPKLYTSIYSSKIGLGHQFDPWLLLIHPICSHVCYRVLPHSPMRCQGSREQLTSSEQFREQHGVGTVSMKQLRIRRPCFGVERLGHPHSGQENQHRSV